eukprot:scaffold1583_cov123-Skeletonema_dohrnii-CCMP3373.AAC.10
MVPNSSGTFSPVAADLALGRYLDILDNIIGQTGGLAQLVERVLSMHEVGSSILPFSTGFLLFAIAITTLGMGRRKSRQHSISTSLGRP